MTQKTISLSIEAYKQLARLKKKDESFSQLIFRLTESKSPAKVEEFAGIWKESQEWDEIEKEIYKRRLKPVDLDAHLG
ncbi:MAG: hypothetical protein RBG13Loki_2176 [Promethearchaeota archaeon CR_4]|nr:MAG: hypothetical protein RBG13Loki_2176 [Candidatus Lokiarchaeota archaeon CR_4]